MHRKLTVTLEESVYQGLHAIIGRRNISRFLSDLARPHVTGKHLEKEYREMAADALREEEALVWTDNLTGDAFDATR